MESAFNAGRKLAEKLPDLTEKIKPIIASINQDVGEYQLNITFRDEMNKLLSQIADNGEVLPVFMLALNEIHFMSRSGLEKEYPGFASIPEDTIKAFIYWFSLGIGT